MKLETNFINKMTLLHLTFFVFSVIAGCSFGSSGDNYPESNIKLIISTSIDVPEPSGLALSVDGHHLWTVSDRTGLIYKMDMSGNIVLTLDYIASDPEGITQSPTDSTLWIVQETSDEIIQIDTLGREIKRFFRGDENRSSGIEGIAYDPSDNVLAILNEKKPGYLYYLDEDFVEIKSKELDFAKDYSGLQIDHLNGLIWIVSDESRAIYKLDKDGNVLTKNKIDVDKVEGIAIDAMSNKIYLVSDSDSELYIYRYTP